jgi:hypothetical protein
LKKQESFFEEKTVAAARREPKNFYTEGMAFFAALGHARRR